MAFAVVGRGEGGAGGGGARPLKKMKSETNAIAEWREQNRKEMAGGEGAEGGVTTAKLQHFTKKQSGGFCATRSSIFHYLFLKVCPRLLTLSVLAAAAEVEAGLMARLAAEAIWLSSTSKVGQLVPVAPLMC